MEDVEGDVSLCVHRRGPTPASTAASVVADLCADGSRLPVYWCGMYSPCMTLFQPIFIDGQLPGVLGIGDERPGPGQPVVAISRAHQLRAPRWAGAKG